MLFVKWYITFITIYWIMQTVRWFGGCKLGTMLEWIIFYFSPRDKKRQFWVCFYLQTNTVHFLVFFWPPKIYPKSNQGRFFFLFRCCWCLHESKYFMQHMLVNMHYCKSCFSFKCSWQKQNIISWCIKCAFNLK